MVAGLRSVPGTCTSAICPLHLDHRHLRGSEGRGGAERVSLALLYPDLLLLSVALVVFIRLFVFYPA